MKNILIVCVAFICCFLFMYILIKVIILSHWEEGGSGLQNYQEEYKNKISDSQVKDAELQGLQKEELREKIEQYEREWGD